MDQRSKLWYKHKKSKSKQEKEKIKEQIDTEQDKTYAENLEKTVEVESKANNDNDVLVINLFNYFNYICK